MSAEISRSGVEKALATGQQQARLVGGRRLEDCGGSGSPEHRLWSSAGGVDMALTPWLLGETRHRPPGYLGVNYELDRQSSQADEPSIWV